MFWFDKTHEGVVFGDMRTEEHLLCDGSLFKVAPDLQLDFRDLPFADGSFKLIVFDPPHLKHAGPNSWMGKKYGILGKDWRNDLRKGFAECTRVLAPDGVLIFKWAELRIKTSDVLKLVEMRPLFGHRSGKQQHTHWLCFMKGA